MRDSQTDLQALIQPVLLAGGSGTRLWPLSTARLPKQFLRLVGNRTLFQQTLARVAPWLKRPPLVVCGIRHTDIVASQAEAIGCAGVTVLSEPHPRNTAPAVALAALRASAGGENPLMLVMPCDHAIGDLVRFRAAVSVAAPLAADGGLVTFGVAPTRPETGFGYIRRGIAIGDAGFAVEAFVEKPDRDRAARYLADGGYAWNSGIFLFQAGAVIAELDRLCPDLMETCRQAFGDGTTDAIDAEAFAGCPAISLDHAVMERTERARVVMLDAGWSDVGSWDAVRELGVPDANGNVCDGDVTLSESTGNYVRADRPVVLVGVSNLVVVSTADGIAIVARDRARQMNQTVMRTLADEADHEKL